MDSAPPLPLPPPLAWAPRGPLLLARAGAATPLGGPGWRRSPAAAVVIALAVSLVAVRDTSNGVFRVGHQPGDRARARPAVLPDVQPALAGDTTKPVGLELRETLHRKTLDTLQPAARHQLCWDHTGAAVRPHVRRRLMRTGSRTAVTGSMARSRTWYLVRVTGSGAGASLTMTKLPIPATQVGAEVLGIALSPDGTKLAVGTTPWTTATNVRQTLAGVLGRHRGGAADLDDTARSGSDRGRGRLRRGP